MCQRTSERDMRYAMCMAAVGLLAAPALGQETVSIGAAADTTLFESETGALGSGAGPVLFAGTLLNGNVRRGLVRFDLAGAVPAGATITGAFVRLNMSRAVSATELVGLHRVTRAWGEGASVSPGSGGAGAPAEPGDATWIHSVFPGVLWTNPGGDFETAASAEALVSGVGFYTWSSPGLLADVQAWYANPTANFGWLLQGNEGVNQTVKRFDSREHPNAEVRPSLVVTYVIPNPGTAVLMAVGVLLAMPRRRWLRVR